MNCCKMPPGLQLITLIGVVGFFAFHISFGHAAQCTYTVQNEWNTGFTATVRIDNNDTQTISNWEVSWEYTDGSRSTSAWNANVTGNNPYTATGLSWNSTIPPGQFAEFGVQGVKGTSDTPAPVPAVTGSICAGGGGGGGGNQAPQASISVDVSAGPAPLRVNFDASASFDSDGDSLTYNWAFGDGATATGVIASHTYTAEGYYTASVTVSDGVDQDSATIGIAVNDGTSGGGAGFDNPFAGAKLYVDPVWSAKAAAEPGGSAIAGYNTAVWMDRIGAITDGLGLRGHLDEAMNQGADLFMFVVYDLPNRDCAALASNGELRISENGFERYQTEYIAPIASILSDPAYKDLRIVAIIEVDSLPNLVTNLDIPDCAEANGPGGYRDGIRHTLNQLAKIDNVYAYIDVAHSGWLGWSSNFGPAVSLIANVVTDTDAGWGSIAGFVTNSANYTPVEEPFLPDPTLNVGGQPVRAATFYEFNDYLEERRYAEDWRDAMIAQGAPASIGMLIDTGRNGWGGDQRPTAVSQSSNHDNYVNESRIDRRLHRGNWCNQAGGVGFRPQASPYPGIDAFVWVKPQGESDGISDPDFEPDPDDPAKQHDPMCDPNANNRYEPSVKTGALDNAPHAGRWFPEAFQILLHNAYPPLSGLESTQSREE